MKCLSLFFLLLFNGVVPSEFETKTEPGDLIQIVIDRFDKISDASIDLTAKLNLIKETSAAFLKLAGPLGGLFAASLDIVSKPESMEYKALKKLNEHMSYRFDRLDERISYAFDAEEMDTELREFKNFITLQLNVLSRRVKWFSDPTIPKSADSIADLLSYCKGTNGVEKMAEYIQRHVSQDCELDNTLVFVKVENLWLKLEQKFNVSEWTRHERRVKRRILSIIYALPSDQGLEQLERIERRLSDYSSFESTIDGAYELIKHKMPENPTRCLTDAVFNGNMYNRVRISFFGNLIQTELARLMAATMLCGNFTYPDSTELLDQFLLAVGTMITNTSRFLVDYIPQKLNMSSSGPEALIVSKLIKKYPGGQSDIPHTSFYGLGDHIRQTLANVGPELIEKQMLVAPSENSDSHFNAFYVCVTYWCTTVLNQRGVDVMIARFSKDQIFFNRSLRTRREYIQPKIVEVLKKDYYISLPRLIEELKTNNVTLVTEYARSAALIRHKTAAAVPCEYPTIPQEYRRDPTDVSATVHFKHNNFNDKGWFDDNTCHQFFFFL